MQTLKQPGRNHYTYVVEVGDLCYWVDNTAKTASRCRVELITDTHVYVRFTATDHGRLAGSVTREARFSKRVAPRGAVDFLVKTNLTLRSPIPWHRIFIPAPTE